MALKDKRRLEIWLPADHPIFSYPSGVRATIARERLDMDMRLADMKKSLVSRATAWWSAACSRTLQALIP